jgi:hypothetical protein
MNYAQGVAAGLSHGAEALRGWSSRRADSRLVSVNPAPGRVENARRSDSLFELIQFHG